MSQLLTPRLAANAANIAYDFQPLADFEGKTQLDELARKPFVDSGFSTGRSVQADVISGTSGNSMLAMGTLVGGEAVGSAIMVGTPLPLGRAVAPMLRKRSGFAIAIKGTATGKYRDHLLVAIRGTSGAADILSDMNCSLSPRFGVGLVHGGFSDIFETLIDELHTKTNNFRGVEAVHIAGHSLGGALATLLAAELLRNNINNIYCYTFGAPRVGNYAFGQWLSTRIGKDRYKRVYHPGDPVPMAPVFPFMQAPFDSGIKLHVPEGTIINPSHHSMEDSYLELVKDYSWIGLETRQNLRPDWKIEIEAWLNGDRGFFDIGISSQILLERIKKAIIFIMEKMILIGLSTAFTIESTILDHLAEALYLFARKAVEFATWVTNLIKAILRFLGIAIIKGISLTVAFIRYVFDRLMAAMSAQWRKAVDMVYSR